MKQIIDFFKRHIIISHLLLIVVATFGVVIIANIFFGIWTGHGDVRTVPAIKTKSFHEAKRVLSACDLVVEIMDSVYYEGFAPGVIVEQSPEAGSTVKPNRTVYVTLNAMNPPKLTVPALEGVSLRQAKASLIGIGFKDVRVQRVPSRYKDLVIAVKSIGIEIAPGSKLDPSTPITIVVGQGAGIDNSQHGDSNAAVTDEEIIEDINYLYD